MNKEILRLEDISLSYDNKKTYVLKGISFWVLSWEVLSIIWVNWSWKSSLLKMIAWVLKPTSWNIIKNYNSLSYVPQKVNIDDSFPIRVLEFISIYNPKVKKEDIKVYLEKLWISDLEQRTINSLSWWQLQKVFIVSALVAKPDLILLDEPTAWIDIIWEEIFYKNIKDIKEIFPNIAIILVSHNINLVYKNSNKVICLHENNFCCHGTPVELSKNSTIKKIFWEYVLPYEHHPHNHEEHEGHNH